jgi:metal-responsive CopG/Arc/MetJ family transcriptional regulator
LAVNRTVTGDDDMAPEGTPFRRIRMDDDLWERLDEAVKRADPDSNRSVIIRRFARWYVGDIDEMPRRPEPRALP